MNIPDRLLCEFLYEIDALEPCNLNLTRQLIKNIGHLPEFAKVANVSCGYGNQSLVLQDLTEADIIAIDHRYVLVEMFQEELKFQKLDEQIVVKHSGLDQLPLKEKEVDMLWVGDLPSSFSYTRVLNDWKRFIKESGHIVIPAYCWNLSYKPIKVSTFFRDCG